MSSLFKRRQIERLLGVSLPEHLDDLHYFKSQPGADLSYYVAYLKLGASRDDFIDLATRMGMSFSGTGGDAGLYLPAAWGTAPELSLDWWDAGPDTPADSAARRLGSNGWIVAKYERGRVYLIATDTGRDEDASGFR